MYCSLVGPMFVFNFGCLLSSSFALCAVIGKWREARLGGVSDVSRPSDSVCLNTTVGMLTKMLESGKLIFA